MSAVAALTSALALPQPAAAAGGPGQNPGCAPQVISAARETAMNPAVLDAFALVICGAGEGPAYPGVASDCASTGGWTTPCAVVTGVGSATYTGTSSPQQQLQLVERLVR